MGNIKFLLFLLVACFLLAGCGGQEGDKDSEGANLFVDEELEITVEMVNDKDNTIGTAILSEGDEGVHVQVQATHLPPGELAIHFHENGICEPPEFESAGGHFNPDETSHGLNNSNGPHAGDMPNLEVGEDGTVTYEVVNEMVTLKEDQKNSLTANEGTAIIIHEDADDGESQPAGNAGARIACGVVGNN